MFEKIIGYESIKQELSTIIHWYTESDLDPAIRLPRGIFLAGAPGLGKTLFLRAVMVAAPLPVYPFVSSNEQEVIPELTTLFEKASAEPNGSIILIDELDTLIDRHSRAERCLKELMDGLTPQNRVLFLASANEFLRRGGNPLFRPGRFDRVIHFERPDEQERHDILSYYLHQHKQILAEEDLNYLTELTDGCSNADLAAIVTDACLRNRGKELTADMLERAHALISFEELPEADSAETLPWIPCVHEIGHAILIDRYREHYHLHRIVMNKKGAHNGACYYTTDKVAGLTLEAKTESIEIGLGGFLATKILLGVQDGGSGHDLQGARFEARRLVNSFGFNGADKVLREYSIEERNESWLTCLRNERLATKLIRRCERRASQIIRKNRDVILRLAKELQQAGFLSGQRVHEMISEASDAKKLHA